jgi:hypothetical protein
MILQKEELRYDSSTSEEILLQGRFSTLKRFLPIIETRSELRQLLCE